MCSVFMTKGGSSDSAPYKEVKISEWEDELECGAKEGEIGTHDAERIG